MLALDSLQAATEPAPATPSVPGEFLVGFKANATRQQIQALYQTHGLDELEQLYGDRDVRRLAVPAEAADAVSRALTNSPLVEYAEPNFIASAFFTPNDPFYSPYQWHLTNTSYGGIHVEQAWDTTAGAGAVVAVLDTGVAFENYVDSTGSYYVAPDLQQTSFVAGYDFINGDSHANDDHSHGTHVAGTIAQSTNNSTGVSGIAFEASVMPVKVLGQDGSGSYSAIANGIRWAADNDADVINMSLGASSPSQTLEDALAYAYGQGVTIVAAAGNDGVNGVSYPAAYDEYVIAVSATRFDEQLAGYSNYGSSIDLAAPGGDTSVDQSGDGYVDGILQQTFNPSTQNTSEFGYYFFQGTSMAAPHVAGVAALIVSQGVTDPLQVRQVLESSAEDKGASGVDIYYGHGIVDAAAAIASLNSLNTDPIAGDDTADVDEDLSVVISVLGNDSDPDGDAITVSSITQPSNGTAQLNLDNTVTYLPDANYNGSDSFTYTITDGNGGADTATVVINVNPVNDAPVASDDAASTDEETQVTLVVLANDSDIDGDNLTVDAVTQPANGSVVINADYSLTYSPNAGYQGSDSFTYSISDGSGGSDSATVLINVQVPNSVHVGDLDGTKNVKGGSGKWEAIVTVVIHDVTDRLVDGATVYGTWSGAAQGSVSGTTSADGSVTFSSGNINNGSTTTFTIDNVVADASYDASGNHDPDGDSDGSSITVSLNDSVNSPPSASDDSVVTQENTAVTIDVLANDSDADGDAVVIESAGSASNGTVFINDDQTITYTPNDAYFGTDSFTYSISDGNGGSDSATVTVDVQAADGVSVHVGDLDGSATTKRGNRWEATVIAIIHDADDLPVVGVTVTGVWSGDASGTVSGTTDSDGSLVFTSGNIRGGSEATFTVESVSGGVTYDPASNHDPDGDSDGSSITVVKGSAASSLATSTPKIDDPLMVFSGDTDSSSHNDHEMAFGNEFSNPLTPAIQLPPKGAIQSASMVDLLLTDWLREDGKSSHDHEVDKALDELFLDRSEALKCVR